MEKRKKRHILSIFPGLKTWTFLPGLCGFIFFSLGIFTGQSFSKSIPLFQNRLYHFILLFSISFLLFMVFIPLFKKYRVLIWAVMGILVSLLHFEKERTFFNDKTISCLSGQGSLMYGKLSSFPEKWLSGFRFNVICDSIHSENISFGFSEKKIVCYINSSDEKLYPGDEVVCKGRYNRPEKPLNPYVFNEHRYSLLNNIWGTFEADSVRIINNSAGPLVKIFNSVHIKLEEIISMIPEESHRGIIKAMIEGSRGDLSSYTGDIFKKAGIYHLLAISGLHVGIITMALITMFSLLLLPRVLKYSLVIAAIWLYLFFVGPVPSLFRSVIMATLLLSAVFIQKHSSSLNSLGAAGIIWLFINPQSLFSPGFQLSFSATAGIIILFPLFRSLFLISSDSKPVKYLINPVLTSFTVSFCAFISTAPVLLYHFGSLSFSGLIVNIFAVTIIWIIMNLFFICAVLFFIFKPAAVLTAALISIIFKVVMTMAELFAFLPGLLVTAKSPPLLYVSGYALFFTGLAAVKKNLRIKYLFWSVIILSILPPVLITAKNADKNVSLCKLSLKKGWINIIEFPGNKIWITGDIPHNSADYVHSRIIVPWLHRSYGSKMETLVIDSCGINIVHKLLPFMEHFPPEMIVVKHLPRDRLTRENLDNFLADYGTKLVVPEKKDIFIPFKNCTCKVITGPPQTEYQIKTGSGSIIMTEDYTFINTDTPVVLNKKKQRNSVLIESSSDIPCGFKKEYESKSYETFSVDVDGAVSVSIPVDD